MQTPLEGSRYRFRPQILAHPNGLQAPRSLSSSAWGSESRSQCGERVLTLPTAPAQGAWVRASPPRPLSGRDLQERRWPPASLVPRSRRSYTEDVEGMLGHRSGQGGRLHPPLCSRSGLGQGGNTGFPGADGGLATGCPAQPSPPPRHSPSERPEAARAPPWGTTGPRPRASRDQGPGRCCVICAEPRKTRHRGRLSTWES